MYGSDDDAPCSHSDHYGTKEAAKRAANRMGISGCHSMRCRGERVYMPGSSHEKYMDATETGMQLFSGGAQDMFDPEDFGL